MTQQQILQEFRNYSTKEQVDLINKFVRVVGEKADDNKNEQTHREKRLAAFKRLNGILATENPPTDEEIKEDYINFITEKYS